eukprot:11071207-Karenia_brevis.AAC.1
MKRLSKPKGKYSRSWRLCRTSSVLYMPSRHRRPKKSTRTRRHRLLRRPRLRKSRRISCTKVRPQSLKRTWQQQRKLQRERCKQLKRQQSWKKRSCCKQRLRIRPWQKAQPRRLKQQNHGSWNPVMELQYCVPNDRDPQSRAKYSTGKRGFHGIIVVTVNTTQKGPLLQYVKGSKAHLLLVQEHHVLEQDVADFREQLKAIGWYSQVSAAIPTQEGTTDKRCTSAGTAILWRRTLNVYQTPAQASVQDTMGGRITNCTWRPRRCLPIDVYSVYLHCNVGLGPENVAILQEVARRNLESGSPILCGGDFNISPQELEDMGWPAGIEGVITAGDPNIGTCTSSLPASNIDFF